MKNVFVTIKFFFHKNIHEKKDQNYAPFLDYLLENSMKNKINSFLTYLQQKKILLIRDMSI